jgi:hypothetical protein
MKNFVLGLAVIIIAMAVIKLWDYYNPSNPDGGTVAPPAAVSGPCSGLAPERQREVEGAKKRGRQAFKMLLDRYKAQRLVIDPALACLELDYVVMVSQFDPVEAGKVFSDVDQRTPANSPVRERIDQLKKGGAFDQAK